MNDTDEDDNNQIIDNQNEIMEQLTLSSPAFNHNGKIPSQYTCDGEGVSPALAISGVDANVKSLVLIMDDPDAPAGVWVHWVKFNISPDTKVIEEGSEPDGVSGVGTAGNKDYHGPCPPDKEHRYFFKLYALDVMLDIGEGATKKEVEEVMEGHILQQAELVGLYKRD